MNANHRRAEAAPQASPEGPAPIQIERDKAHITAWAQGRLIVREAATGVEAPKSIFSNYYAISRQTPENPEGEVTYPQACMEVDKVEPYSPGGASAQALAEAQNELTYA